LDSGDDAPIEILIVLVAILGTPLSVSAHVNGVVGPYTFLVVLIEEPYYATNRAGFDFWVREGDRPVESLDRTLKAKAISSTQRVDLAVSSHVSVQDSDLCPIPG
jgi:hypothetical protein